MFDTAFIAILFIATAFGLLIGFEQVYRFASAALNKMIEATRRTHLLMGYVARAYMRYRRNIEKHLA